jgi:hypothetical protein
MMAIYDQTSTQFHIKIPLSYHIGQMSLVIVVCFKFVLLGMPLFKVPLLIITSR